MALATSIIITAIADADAVCPVSAMFNTDILATIVSGEYKNTTAEVVVIAFMNR